MQFKFKEHFFIRHTLTIIVYLNKKILFQKTVIIGNSGKRLITFKLLTSNLSGFDYDYKPACPLAAGMKAKLTITFKCTSMEDTYELITIMTNENKKINILVGAENESPILNCKYIEKKTYFL